jgi:hypothetical protein
VKVRAKSRIISPKPVYRDTARDWGSERGADQNGPQGSSGQSGLPYRAAAKAVISSSDGEIEGAS